MRLGGPVFGDVSTPEKWAAAVRSAGYAAAYAPSLDDAAGDEVKAYADAAHAAGFVIAEVGAWSNLLHPDLAERARAVELNVARLALAESIGARCCVNISGSRGPRWDGPHPLNLTDETFNMVVASVRHIIDAVKPRRTFYTLETMPWMYPDSADNYLRLIQAVDRKAFAVHFDPVNLMCSPHRFYANAEIIREFVAKLGRWIRSCHAKDVRLSEVLTTHIDEVAPGRGELDYRTFLCDVHKLDPDTPLMMEHLNTPEEYVAAEGYIRSVATSAGITFVA